MKKFLLGLIFSLLSFCSFAQTTDYYLENLSTTDTYLRSSLPNNSFGSDQNLVTGGWGDMYITLIKFNISSLPAIATGDKVSLWLYNKSPGGAAQPTAVNMGLAASDFSNSTTWSNGVSWYTSTIRQVNVSAYGYWTEFDITDYYNYWKAGVANYGVVMVPLNTNNYFNFFQSSSTSTPGGQKPLVRVTKASSKIVLKWPLSTSYSSRVITQGFGVDWSTGTRCPTPNGPIKKHNGVDYVASAGSTVYAAYDGTVKALPSQAPYGSAIVLEHTKSDGNKFTTVYWHVNSYVGVGSVVTKGYPIGSIYDQGGNTHFHFGIRNSAYSSNSSGTGSLPVNNCDVYPAFPDAFVNPESNSFFQLQ